MTIARSGLWAVTAILAIFLGACAEKASLQVRTDAEPLSKRLNLPRPIGAVRWVAVSPVHDTGWIPPKAEFYDIYSYIQLDERAWEELEKAAALAGTRETITIPDPVAALVIPAIAGANFRQSTGAQRAEGPSFRAASLSAEANTEVQEAIRVGDALVVHMRVR